jgi:hypothetical protein
MLALPKIIARVKSLTFQLLGKPIIFIVQAAKIPIMTF